MADTIAGLAPIMQLAFVPRDADAALDHWTKVMGVGPFFHLAHIDYTSATHRGAPSNLDFSAFIAYWGDLQIEIIQQHCDSPSIYKSWLDEGREGLHHVCMVVDDLAHARAVCAAAGAAELQAIVLPGVEAFYADTGGGPGTMVEILQAGPDFTALCDMMREAARGWDGSDPIRPLG